MSAYANGVPMHAIGAPHVSSHTLLLKFLQLLCNDDEVSIDYKQEDS
jgi:hypothetical protein